MEPLPQAVMPSEERQKSYAQLMDQQMDTDLRRLSQFLLRHPSLTFTFAYLIASVMGLIFTIGLLAEFNFNALPYLELTDFLLAAITHPQVFAILAVGLFALAAVLMLERHCRRRFSGFARWADRYYRSSLWLPNWVTLALVLILYLFFAANSQVPGLAAQIKHQKTASFRLSLIYPLHPGLNEVRQLDQVQVITRTASYLWLYHQGQIKLIPHANVAALIPVQALPTEKRPAVQQLKPVSPVVVPVNNSTEAQAEEIPSTKPLKTG